MEAVRFLDDCAFGAGRDLLHLRDGEPIARDERNRHAEVAGERRIENAFRHFGAVQPDAEQPRARNRVAADRIRRPLARVIADEHGRGERLVDSLHHFQRTRKSAHDPYVVGHFVDEEALAVSVRVADDDLGGSRVADAVDGGIHFAGHPLARALVFEAVRPELRRLDDAADAFVTVITDGKVTGDGIGPHEDLLAEFPYLGPPHKRDRGGLAE